MGAAKKKRGQQRKAAAKDFTTATNNDTTGRSGSGSIGGDSVNKRQVIKALNKLPQKQIVEMVQKRDPLLHTHYLNLSSREFCINAVVYWKVCSTFWDGVNMRLSRRLYG